MASNLETTGASVSPEVEHAEKPEGPVSAAILAGGVGAFALGVLTTLAEASEGFKNLLNLYDPVGPLSGKTIGAVIVWLIAWAVLHLMYRGKAIETRKALTASLILIALGVLGTFPIFFQAFAAG
ncbi:hypothetical protein KZX45_00865 [Georgenia sp. EYE_87]|uniref:hypothetical protein n=1 Tax=Georgenia sp. EYE_87 TaxID=2853448 RepID=UPI002002E63A|nr:hypothetical protein [Georgenia sp. EYE_87]MCK6209093.1 hypothetical protein [Georgenia sp. EYE_87]